MAADGKRKAEVETLKFIRTPLLKGCPVCGEAMSFIILERTRNGKRISKETLKDKNEVHSVKKCIRKWQNEQKEDGGWNEEAEICRNCEYYVNDYICSSEIQYCTHPDYTFEKSSKVMAFQREYEAMDWVSKPRSYAPAKTVYAYTNGTGSCDKFEREKPKDN